MAANELDSFVYKFKNLWRNGQEASLNVKSKAGRAWIELHVELGHPLDLPPPYIYHQDGVPAHHVIDAEIGVLPIGQYLD